MKIVFVDPSLFTWPYDLALAKGLEAAGNEVAIYGRRPAADEGIQGERFLIPHFYRGLDTRFVGGLPTFAYISAKGASHVASMVRMLRRFKDTTPDIIHFQWTPLAPVDRWFIPQCRRIAATLLTVHDSMPFNANPRSSLQRIGATAIMRQFDGIIVHTEAARARVAGYGVAPDRINIVPHGLLLADGVCAGNGVRDGARDTGRPPDVVTLLLFGKLKPYKGADILLRALAHLPEELRRKCRLLIAGKPYMDMRPLMASVDALGLGAQVTFDLRYIPDEEIAAIFASADIHVFPYREIDASGALMAAVATGQVIVASRIGLFAEMLEDGRSAALVPIGDPRALANALAPLIADRARRETMRREVIALRRRIPSWDAIANQTLSVYLRAADARLGGSGSRVGKAETDT